MNDLAKFTAQEKGKEIYNSFLHEITGGKRYGWNHDAWKKNVELAKQCALICVENVYTYSLQIFGDLYLKTDEETEYWLVVKEEIKKQK